MAMIDEGPCAGLRHRRIADRRMPMKIGLGMALALLLAESQTVKVHRIAFLGLSSPADYATSLEAFRQGLRDLGYEEGRNISIEYRWAAGRDDRLPVLAAELVRLNPDVLVTHAAPGIRAAQQATSTIPIIMGAVGDPVRLGFVKSLAKPGGNTTGVSSQLFVLAAKRLDLLKETVPNLRQVAVLSNLTRTGDPAAREGVREMEVAAPKLGLRVRTFEAVMEPPELERVLTAILRERPDGLVVLPDSAIVAHNVRIAEFAARNRLPAMGGERLFVAAGGLISYENSFPEGWRVAARYVVRVLNGAKPAELPIEQPTTFHLAINLKTAKRLGLTIPPSLLLRADQVTE
jgi:ABC-type uncharacterized transport system substrate-binding protein